MQSVHSLHIIVGYRSVQFFQVDRSQVRNVLRSASYRRIFEGKPVRVRCLGAWEIWSTVKLSKVDALAAKIKCISDFSHALHYGKVRVVET